MGYAICTQFEPLLPQKQLEQLDALAQKIITVSAQLHNAVHHTTAAALASLLREMNSYYSNKIEGHSTHPLNIARSLHKEFSAQPKIAQLQRLALAHIEAEIEIETWLRADSAFSPFSAEGIRRIHAALYQKLPVADRTIEQGHIVAPGVLRDADVQIGSHVAPAHSDVPAFLTRYEAFYTVPTTPTLQLIKIASAHHRLTWIHPFLDGNGRVARLATHAALYRHFSSGLWSICRGLARSHKTYYTQLALADEPRRGDLDGRGNLTEAGLASFCHYFLSLCLDQVNFMLKLLDLDGMRKRIGALIVFRSEFDKKIRREAILPLHYLFTSGPLSRAEFKQMTGLGDKVAQVLLSHLLKAGLVKANTPLGAVQFGLPLDALQFYFPDLYPEVDMRLDDK